MNDFQKMFSWLLTAVVGFAVVVAIIEAITASPPMVAMGILAVVLFSL